MRTQCPTKEVRLPVRDAIPAVKKHKGPARDVNLAVSEVAPVVVAHNAAVKIVDAVSAAARQAVDSATTVPVVFEISEPTEMPMVTLI